MKYLYAKMTFRMVLISFLALILIGCGESGTPGGSSGPGVTASINLSAGDTTLPADGVTSTTITAVLVDSVNAPVFERTSVVFRTSRGTFRNGSTEYHVKTPDTTGTVSVTLISDSAPGTAKISAECNNITQKTEVKFFDPTKVGTITLRTGSASITADGISQVSIIAAVNDAQGNPEEGAMVSFKTSLGHFMVANPLPGIVNQNTTATTDVDGEASVMLLSSKTIGTATILASLNGLNTSTSVIFTADDPNILILRAAPSTIKPGGVSNLFATLMDINGNPVAGKTIVFSEPKNKSEGTLNSLSASTNVNGEAQVSYTGGNDPAEDIIQAALSTDLGMKTTTTIVVDPGAIVISSINVTAGATSLVANGQSQVKIRAVVTDIDGNPVIGKTVTFKATAGLFDNNQTVKTEDTSGDGLAEVMLQSTTISGPVTVRAECDGFIGEVSVNFVPGPADHILMYAFPDTVPPNGAFQTAAIVQDQYDNRIDDQRLMLQVRLAGHSEIVDTAEMTPDQAEDGVFRFDWNATSAYGEGNLEVTARVNNGTQNHVKITVDETATIVGSINVIAGADEIKADGSSSVLIRATVLDSSGQPVEGLLVDFSTTLGRFNGKTTTTATTNANGIADVMLTAGTTWGTATVTANANGFWGQIDVRLTSLTAGGVSLTAMPDSVVPGGQSTVIAELHDTKGAPVPNELLYFDIYENNTNAILDSISGITDTNGRVTIIYTAGVDVASLCNICACSGDRIRVVQAGNSAIKAEKCINVAAPTGTVGRINLSSALATLPADGVSSTPITATVYDTAGVPMPEGTVITLVTDLGSFSADVPLQSISRETIDDSGTIIVSLISDIQKGIATLVATSGGISQSILISFSGGGGTGEAEMLIDVSKRVIDATGSSSSEVQVLLRDDNHNPIEGAAINFSTSLGTIVGKAITGADGYAYVNNEYPVLISARQNGVATVRAWYGPTSAPYASAETDVAFSGLTITVTADPDSLSTAEEATIEATLRGPAGDAMVDQEVILETDLGKFTVIDSGTVTNDTQFTAKTNSSGKISVKLSSSSGGTAEVKGWHAPTKGQPGETMGSKKVIFSGKKLTMTPSQDWLVADGASSMDVLLSLEDESGNPVSGQIISLATTLGNVDNFVTTDSQGEAVAVLRTGTVIGVAKLTAIAELADDVKISVTTEVSFIRGDIQSIELIANPSIIKTVTGSSEIRAIVRDVNGNPVHEVNVAFTIIAAPGAGETLTPSIAQTGGAGSVTPGQVSAVFTAGSLGSTSVNDVIIEASVGNIVASTSLTITSQASNISLGACTTTNCITDNGDGSYSIPISAVISDVNGIAVPAGVVVTFAVANADRGIILSPVSTDNFGRATTVLTYPATRAGSDIIIIASTGGLSESVTIELPSFNTFAIADISLQSPTNILGDGVSYITLQAQAVDSTGSWVIGNPFFDSSVTMDFTGEEAGYVIDYQYNLLGLVSTKFFAFPGPDEDGDSANGFVSQDYNAYVKAYAGNTVESNINTILVKGITLAVSPEKTTLLANGTSKTLITAVLKETTTGLPIVGKELNFGVNNGLIEGSAITDGSGTVQVEFTSIQSDIDLTASIRCYYGSDIMASTEIDLVASSDVGSLLASSDKNTIPNDPAETATITVQVLDDKGNPATDGQRVTFEILSGPGQVDASATTIDGMATATFRATPDTGVSQIKVASGLHEVIIEIEIVEDTFVVGALNLTSASMAIPADGQSSVSLTASVLDSTGSPMENANILMTTDHGKFSTDGTQQITRTTDASGNVRFSLIAGDESDSGTATIIATAGTITQKIEIAIVGAGDISIAASPPEIVADGDSESAIIVTVLSSDGTPIEDNTRVNFRIVSGGGHLRRTNYNYYWHDQQGYDYTVGGSASVVYVAPEAFEVPSLPETPGTAVIEATIPGTNYDAVETQISLISGVGGIQVFVSSDQLKADGSSTSTISAIVTDGHGNPVEDGSRINFRIESGTGGFPYSTTDWAYTAGGAASVSYRASNTPGSVTIKVLSEDNLTSSSTVIELVEEIDDLIVYATPPQIAADDESTAIIVARLVDPNGLPVPDGTRVNFNITSGYGDFGASRQDARDYTSGSIATATFYAPASKDISEFSSVSEVITNIEVTVPDNNNLSRELEMILLKPIGNISILANPAEIFASGQDVSIISALLTDPFGNPVANNTKVYFSTTGGYFDYSGNIDTTSYTTNGLATAKFYSTTSGTFTITINDEYTQANQTLDVKVNKTGIGSILLSANPVSLPADGVSSTVITINILDTRGKAVPAYTEFELSTSMGTFIDPETQQAVKTISLKTVDASGKVLIPLISGLAGGIADVKITAGGVSQSLNITMNDIGNVQVSLDAFPARITADGVSQSTFTATVLDMKDNSSEPIEGAQVFFKDITATKAGFSGTGPGITDTFSHSGEKIKFTMSHTGESSFLVRLWDTDGNIVKFLKNVIGPITDEVSEEKIPPGVYYIEVQSADGSWTIALEGADAFDALPLLSSVFTDDSGQAQYIYTSTQAAKTVTIGIQVGDLQEDATIVQVAGLPDFMTVTASPNPMHPGTETTVIARLFDANSNPVSGETVNFSLTTNNSGGSLAAASAETDANGEARVVYTAGFSDLETDSITVTSGTFSEVVDIQVDSTVIVVGKVSLTSSLSELPADGSSSAAITVAVFDNNNAAMPAGTPVTLTTTLGTFPGGMDPDGPGPLSSRLLLSTSSDSGQVITSLIAPLTETGNAMIIAVSGGVSQVKYISIGGDGGGGGVTVNAVGLVASQTALSPEDTTTITAMAYDSSGHGIGGEYIDFSLDDPTLGFITAGGTTAADGTFVADFEARSNTGTVFVTAAAGTITSAPLEITIKDQFVERVTLTVNPTAITVTNTATVSALVKDISDQPVPSATVTFALQDSAFGTITSSAVTNAVGVATATFTAANFPGTATILATSGSATATPVDLDIQPAEAASIEFDSVSKNPISIRGTGGQEFGVIKFNVKDVNGNPGEDVDVLVTMVSGIQGSEYLEDPDDGSPYEQVVGTSGGVAEVTLHSGYEAGTVSVTASIITSGGTTISATTPIISIGGGVVTDEWLVVSCEEPGWNLGGLECVDIQRGLTAWLADRFGNYNVLDGHTVSFQSEIGLAVNPIGITSGATGSATSTVRTQGAPKDVVPEQWELDLISDIETTFGLPPTGGHPRDGLSNVLVFTIGEESFVDGSNGNAVNGVYDAGEDFVDTIDDPWRDYDDDGLWDNGSETTPWTTGGTVDPGSGITVNPEEDEYQDRAANDQWDGANGVWDGNKNLYRQVDFLITGTPIILFDQATFDVPNGGSVLLRVLICDYNYNPMSAGSTWSVSIDNGKVTPSATYEYASSSAVGPGISYNRIVFDIVVADADPAKIEPKPAELKVTVNWSGGGACADKTFTLPLVGTVE